MGFSPSEAEDLAQDVFVTFLETIERFEGRSEVGTWLFGILHHKAQERRRAHAREELSDALTRHSRRVSTRTGRGANRRFPRIGWWRPVSQPRRSVNV
jgi:RNA polymerase sigma-70 factor (ECF subfamily)